MAFRWLIEPGEPDLERELSRGLRISALLARMLVNRGVRTVSQARRFLRPRLTDLEEPEQIPGMERAAERLAQAVRRREPVLIFGDYDADGLCGSALLTRLLRRFGLPVRHYLPHRIQEGYGLNRKALQSIAADGVPLVVTVDCGMDAWQYEDLLRDAPFDLVVVDHHEPTEPITSAAAVVNPRLEPEGRAWADLAGVGVVFKLGWALARRLGPRLPPQQDLAGLFTELLALAAVGTVADVAPLLDENRIITRLGLEALRQTTLPGLRALIGSAGLTDRPIRAEDIAFRLGPRLNAAGRMGEAELALRLLLTDSPEEALEVCTRLEAHNTARRQAQEKMEQEALEQLGDIGAERVLVVHREGWSPGIVGIVAGRLTGRFHRPTAVVATEGDLARGSARSIPGFHILEALKRCADCLLAFGGHAQAAGFTLERNRVPELRRRLNQFADELPARLWQPTLTAEAEVPLSMLTREVVAELALLEPLGEQNPQPVLISHRVEVLGDIRRLGSRGKHLSFYARQGERALRVIGFNLGERAAELAALRSARPAGGAVSLAYTPALSTFRSGEPEVELKLHDFRPAPKGV